MWNIEKKIEFENIKDEVLLSGGTERIEREHKKGKLTARERMELLFDDGEFLEINMLVKSRVDSGDLQKKHYLGDGVIAGYGKLNGFTVYAVSQDCTISGGSAGEAHIQKICETLELAMKTKSPFVCLCDSGGARIEEGIISSSAYSRLFYLNTQASGYIPQIAAIMGNCAGGATYSPAMCDFVFMVENTSQFFITGPRVIKALTGESVSMDELGGPQVHSVKSGVANFVCKNDEDCINSIKELLNYLEYKKEPFDIENDSLYEENLKRIENIVPDNMKQGYDVKKVISCIVDDNSFFEVSKDFARNMVVGFARLEGKSIGIVANQPCVLGGAIDCDASDKTARFVRFCDCFDIPLLVLLDSPGFYPGPSEEKKGILRHGSKVLYAFSEATVPRVTVITRKAYGASYCAMNSKAMGADVVFAWPICESAVMGAEAAVNVMYNKQIAKAQNANDFKREKIRIYEKKYLNPYFAASIGMVDEVILPQETRKKLVFVFQNLEDKQVINYPKKHGNIPL
ncbi:MAG: acyl-CoA carboxylase subunit beta [Clostridia bacterium]|nr:acyl-CoA carboxylase subunit beta [Clostridia bacterium]